jgi:hypothetical protein
MNVIDKILNEWSYRCHDGIVDMNDPTKISILNEILEEIGFQETIQEIMSLRKEVIDTLINNYKDELGPHSRPGRIKNIGNIKPEDFILKIKETFKVPEVKKIEAGSPENPSMSNPAFEFKYKNQNIIIVLGKEAPGLEAEKNQINYINNIIKENDKPISIKINEKIYNNIIKATPATKNKHADFILVGDSNLYIQYKDKNNFQQYSGIEKFLKEKEVIDFINAVKTQPPVEKEGKGYKKSVSYELGYLAMFGIGENFSEDKVQIICLEPIKLEPTDKENIYELVSNKITYLDKTISEEYKPYLAARYASDRNQMGLPNTRFGFYPKKYVEKFKEIPTAEDNTLTEELTNYLTELFNTDHFELRTNERGNVLDILNLEKIPLKDYKSTDVKEKLKQNISAELKNRAEKILGKDIPSSVPYDVGVKLLKPVLVVDGEKYPLMLFARSTKEIKDKEGNVKEVIEVDNKGTLYFATVADNKATTLLLLDKEDDNELYFQIKKHIERKGKDKEAKILTPSNYVYEIDLDELMGKEKEKQGPKLIDPATLPYNVRTDYRVDANFDHEKYGTGKIVATSAGSGGKGDSRGKLDWIDVKYPKPYLKGGKLTDIRRFEDIYTLASPLLAK